MEPTRRRMKRTLIEEDCASPPEKRKRVFNPFPCPIPRGVSSPPHRRNAYARLETFNDDNQPEGELKSHSTRLCLHLRTCSTVRILERDLDDWEAGMARSRVRIFLGTRLII